DTAAPHGSPGGGTLVARGQLEPILDFLEFIDVGRDQPLKTLLHHILLKARQLTEAEAGTIFILRASGGRRYLEPGSLQNDAIKPSPKKFVLPISKESIAGYVAATGETLFIDDLYAIPPGAPYTFRQETDQAIGYRSRTMLAFPLTNGKGEVVAVVQLINRRPARTKQILPFEPGP